MNKLPTLALDALVESKGRILLIKRLHEPFKGCWAFPGGRMDYGESPEEGCLRELREETCLHGKIGRLVGVYGDPKRDPRGHVVSIAYAVHVDDISGLKASDDAQEAQFFPLEEARAPSFRLAFDHARILDDYLSQTGR